MWLADTWQVDFCFPPSNEKHEWRGLYNLVANESEVVRSLWDDSRRRAYNGPVRVIIKGRNPIKMPRQDTVNTKPQPKTQALSLKMRFNATWHTVKAGRKVNVRSLAFYRWERQGSTKSSQRSAKALSLGLFQEKANQCPVRKPSGMCLQVLRP